jgi:hypothetical protein
MDKPIVMHTSYKYAARLNSFKNGVSGDASPAQRGMMGLLSRAASVPGLNAVDLNFPDHLGLATEWFRIRFSLRRFFVRM